MSFKTVLNESPSKKSASLVHLENASFILSALSKLNIAFPPLVPIAFRSNYFKIAVKVDEFLVAFLAKSSIFPRP